MRALRTTVKRTCPIWQSIVMEMKVAMAFAKQHTGVHGLNAPPPVELEYR